MARQLLGIIYIGKSFKNIFLYNDNDIQIKLKKMLENIALT